VHDDDALSFRPVALDAPLRPGKVRNRSPTWQARWIDRTLLECLALLLALLGPPAAAFLLARGTEYELLLPLTSLVSAVLVAAIAVATPYGRLGFQRGAWRHYVEAVVAAGLGVAFAVAWVRLLGEAPADPISRLRTTLGLLPTLLVVAVAPAVLEEIAFRGLLQGRLLALLGERAGVVTTAIAFAVCHGMPLVLPIHFALGLYLGWLRLRAGTLLPGMLMHFVYNGTLVASGQG
jgi:membrane protease YdiL (CAAX protease family)